MGTKFELSFSSGMGHVKPTLARFMRYLDDTFPGACAEALSDIRLILSELLFNAVIHGNGNDTKKTVRLEAETGGGYLQCFITDQGDGFDYASVLSSFSSCPGDCLESDHGRGVQLARCLSDGFEYMPPGNRVFFKKKVTRHG
ncbi:MAG: ATP-binding protein [Clostridiales bacterium]|jgi:serine/threonine-protein kinase RsbW|nr:ATP-binding protein [Clostridiales bacterium]